MSQKSSEFRGIFPSGAMVVWRARATMGCRSEPTRRPTPATGTDRHNSSNSDYVSVLLLLFGPVPLSLPSHQNIILTNPKKSREFRGIFPLGAIVVWRARATKGRRSEPTRRPTPATGTDRHNSSNSDYVGVLLLLFRLGPLSLRDCRSGPVRDPIEFRIGEHRRKQIADGAV